MSDLALYRKWRSRNFEELAGQPHITRTLHNAVKSGKIAHAYLFCGPRGTGKTSTAKIFAKALNCENGPTPTPCSQCDVCKGIQSGTILDCIEIDAASNRGIDEIRDLREKIKFPPTVCRYKVYIIDEVHMLTPEAFNALLKTLEEPPPQTVFILCTTEPHKLLPTVASRCQRFDFRRIPSNVIQKRLEEVAGSEGLQVESGVFPLIARASDGSLRDALSLLDQLRTFSPDKIEMEKTLLLLGRTKLEMLTALAGSVAEKNLRKLLITLHEFLEQGVDLSQLMRDLAGEFRKLLLWKISPELVEGSDEEKEWLRSASPRFQSEELYRILRSLSDLRNELRYAPHPQLSAEIVFMRIIHLEWEANLEGLKKRIELLEQNGPRAATQNIKPVQEPAPVKLASGLPTPQQPAAEKEITLDEVRSRWPEMMEKLRSGRHLLYPALQASIPVKLEGKTLTIMVQNQIFKNSLEQKKEEVRRLLKETFQTDFQLLGEVQPIDHEAFNHEAEKIFEGTFVSGEAGV